MPYVITKTTQSVRWKAYLKPENKLDRCTLYKGTVIGMVYEVSIQKSQHHEEGYNKKKQLSIVSRFFYQEKVTIDLLT